MAVESKEKGRLLWLDALKGAGILLVVAGHVWTHGDVRDAIYLFHMPLFFIAAGYTARVEPVNRAAQRGLVSLMLPWAVFAMLLLGLDSLIEGLRGVRPIFPDPATGIIALIWQTEAARGPFTILWFVPCLFLARLLWCVIASQLPRLDDPRWFAAALALFAVGWEAVQLTGRSPMGMLAVPGACILLWLGSLWRARPPERELLGFIILVAVLALVFLPPVNMKAGDIGLPVIGLLGAAAVCVALGAGVQSLPSAIQHGLAWLGTRSLVIMYVHVAAIHYAAPYMPKAGLLVFALAVSLLIDALARSTRPLRFLMLGQRN
jgi:fucose 4-O-acetylase-like acetyltransferase